MKQMEAGADSFGELHDSQCHVPDPPGNASRVRADGLIDWFISWARHLNIESFDRSGSFAPSDILELAKAGMLGMGVPVSLGGSDLPVSEILRVLRQVAAVDLTVAVFVLDSILGAHTAQSYADHARRDRVLEGIAAGSTITAVAITGPEAGSDPRAIEARATPDGEGGWYLDGEKWWVGNASWAEVIHVFVKLYDEAGKNLGLTGFAVNAGSSGLHIDPAVATLGLHGFPKNRVCLQRVRVGPKDLIGAPGQGFETAQLTFGLIRLLLGGMAVGTMKRCIQLMHRYAERRTISTGRLIDNPAMRLHVSESVIKTALVESLSCALAEILDSGAEIPDEAFMAVKNAGAEFMGDVVDRAIQVLGARGYEESYGVARFYRDARPFRIFEGPTEALTAFIGASAAQPDSPLRAFLADKLGGRDLVERLGDATAVFRGASRAPDSEFQGPSALYQTYSYAGEFATYLLLEAVARRNDTPVCQAAAMWANRRAEEVLARARGSDPRRAALLDGEALAGTVLAWGRELKEIVNASSRIVQDPLLAPPAERAPDDAWNDTFVDFGPFRSVTQRIAERAFENGGATAAEQSGTALTRDELERRSNRLANWLLDHGVKRGDRVAFSLSRSLAAIVALLGIHKAGAAWLPLDPAYPSHHKEILLADAGARVVVTERAFLADLPAGPLSLCLDDPFMASEAPPGIEIKADDLAYVIYTSGSTGTPKGVMIEHGALSHFVDAATKAYGITGDDRVLQFAPLSFDTSVEEIYPCLCAGGTLVLRTDDMIGSASLFLAAVAARRVTVLDLPTAFWHLLVDDLVSAGLSVPACLRLVIIGGERCRSVEWRKWSDYVGPYPILMNTYGPTESTVVATACDLSRLAIKEPTLCEATIGVPLRNVRCYVLDEALRPVNVNEPGELCVAGAGLARGYLGLPEKTAESFVNIPVPGRGMERIYRTGDMVRWGEDGQLYFLGRRDHQVKILGYRVELGEVEAAVAALKGVRRAAVIARARERGPLRLLAYVEGPELSAGDSLRRALRERLPKYMVPDVVVVMAELPMTVSGKLDRQSLPEPVVATDGEGHSASLTEARLAELFEEVLGHRMPRDTDFLAAGGNSLLAIQLVARIRDTFGVDLSISDVFRAGTRVALSELLDRGGRPTTAVALKRVSRDDEHPLSHGQAQFWFLHELFPSQPIYNEPVVLFIPEPVNAVALQNAFSALIERHEILRTTFPVHRGNPVQKVLNSVEFKIEVEEREAWDGAAREAAETFVKTPFILSAPPLMRARLVHTGEAFARLVLVFHHLIVDGVSFYRVFLPELQALYEAAASHHDAKLPALDWHYVDYAAWQAQEALNEGDSAFWKAYLTNLPELEMPTDRPRAAISSNKGDHVRINIGKVASDRVRAFARSAGVTPFVVLLAGLNVVLYQYTGQEDLVIGTVVTQRRHAQLDGVMGYFGNTLALRTSLAGQPTFQTLVERVRETVLQAFAHQDLPFAKVVDIVGAAGGRRWPLFRVALILEPPPPEHGTTWRCTRQDLHTGVAKFEFMFELEDSPDGFRGRLEFSTDLYDRATATQLVDHFRRCLSAVMEAPTTHVGAHDMLDSDQRTRAIAEWNMTATSPAVATTHGLSEGAARRPDFIAAYFESEEKLYKELGERRHRSAWLPPELGEMDECITFPKRFELQVERSPDATAVISGDERLSYRELNIHANRIAHRLRSMGVGPEVRVCILLERSTVMLAAILGVLKAGGAYVPIDPAVPRARISFLLEDADPAVVLTQRNLLALLPKSAPTLVLDAESAVITEENERNPIANVRPENAAYILYTSGSTGKPKGVVIEHRNTASFLSAVDGSFKAEELAFVLASTSISFDVSIFELLVPLCRGGTVVLARNVLALADLPDQELVTLVSAVPSAMSALLDVYGIPPSVRTVVLAGEALHQSVADRVLALGHVSKLYNMYGPTEGTTYSTMAAVRAGEAPTIGRAIANTSVFVLDRAGRQVPVGIPGELYLGGDGIARGYFNRPELTAERFIPDPFGTGKRLYKTGDLVRFRPDGELQFIGRIDHQVKLRGFRIELGEIEATLLRHPLVREAAVIKVDDASGDARLVAYAAPDPQADRTSLVETLRTHTRSLLPGYMVPASFVFMPELPKTTSGKIDRRALPPAAREPEIRAEYVEPKEEMELLIADIWRRVLQVSTVGVHDNFFDLGGNSLLLVRVFEALRKSVAKPFAMVQLFTFPTVRSLARALSNNPAGDASLVRAQDRARKQKLALALRRQRVQIKRSSNE